MNWRRRTAYQSTAERLVTSQALLDVYGPYDQRPGYQRVGGRTARASASLRVDYLADCKDTRKRTRRAVAFYALEGVVPWLLVCFGAWLRRLDLAQLSEGHRICAVKTRDARKVG